MWKGLKDISNYKTPFPSTVENQQLAENLNRFYCRFEKNSPHILWTLLHKTINISCNPHTCTSDQWSWCAQGILKAEEKESTRPRLCYTSLSEILCWPVGPYFTQIINKSLELCKVPSCFKRSTTGLNDYRSVYGHEVNLKTGAGPTEGHYWTFAGSSLPTEQTGL